MCRSRFRMVASVKSASRDHTSVSCTLVKKHSLKRIYSRMKRNLAFCWLSLSLALDFLALKLSSPNRIRA